MKHGSTSTQLALIQKHLARESITAMQALKLYGCARLAARIMDLKDRGVKIRTHMIFKGRKHWAQYSMAGGCK